ncbi:MAG TPA: SIMPL domain-containing protein [Nitrolancea sp.]|nr:SIMPL domain-containing protein [Nitrolancea sp.]
MSRLKRAGSVIPVVLALVVGAVFSGLLTGNGGVPMTSIAEAQEQSNQRMITVSGEGRVSVTPDTAQVTLGVQIRNPDLGAAQQEANQKMDAVLAAVKDNGVSDDQIKTVSYNIAVQRDWQKEGQPIIGYEITHLVQVKVKPMDKVSAIIDAAVAKGANAVNDVVFTVENQDAPLQQAREQAVNNARVKAEQLAKLTGVGLGAPVTISETATMPPVPLPMARDVAAPAAAGEAATAVQPGQSEVSVNLTISYAIQ